MHIPNKDNSKETKATDMNIKIMVEKASFVLFQYESKSYPGVVAINDKVLISSMSEVKSGWKWPTKEDRL